MNTRSIDEVLKWLRTTDLAEVTYRKGEESISLALDDVPPQAPALPACSLIPVVSPEVGIFRFSRPGQPRRAEKGADLSEGQVLGFVDTGIGGSCEVKAPASGRLLSIHVEDGGPVEYGQPLFFIQPV